jgi:hypothetical protein
MVHFPNSEAFMAVEKGKLRRAELYLDERAWETIFHLKETHGHDIRTVRVALEALRRQIGLDVETNPTPEKCSHMKQSGS